MLNVECECGKVLRMDDAMAGKKIRCLECGETLLVRKPAVTKGGSNLLLAVVCGGGLLALILGVGVGAWFALGKNNSNGQVGRNDQTDDKKDDTSPKDSKPNPKDSKPGDGPGDKEIVKDKEIVEPKVRTIDPNGLVVTLIDPKFYWQQVSPSGPTIVGTVNFKIASGTPKENAWYRCALIMKTAKGKTARYTFWAYSGLLAIAKEGGTFATPGRRVEFPAPAHVHSCAVELEEAAHERGPGGALVGRLDSVEIYGTAPGAPPPTNYKIELVDAKAEKTKDGNYRVTVGYAITGMVDPQRKYLCKATLHGNPNAGQLVDLTAGNAMGEKGVWTNAQAILGFNTDSKTCDLEVYERVGDDFFTDRKVAVLANVPVGISVDPNPNPFQVQIAVSNAKVQKEKRGVAIVTFDWKITQGKPNPRATYRLMVALTKDNKKFARTLAEYDGSEMKSADSLRQSCFYVNETEFEIYILEVTNLNPTCVSNAEKGKVE